MGLRILLFSTSFRYTDDMELDDAVHTAILTLKEGSVILASWPFSSPLWWRYLMLVILQLFSFEGQISAKNIEIGIIGADKKFRQDYLFTYSLFSHYGFLLHALKWFFFSDSICFIIDITTHALFSRKWFGRAWGGREKKSAVHFLCRIWSGQKKRMNRNYSKGKMVDNYETGGVIVNLCRS